MRHRPLRSLCARPCSRRRTGGSLKPLRRIPTMNAFTEAESNLTLRTRRTLGGSARRMGMRARVLAVVLLCPLAAVTLPSCGATSEESNVSAEPSRDEHRVVVEDQYSNTSGDTATQTEKALYGLRGGGTARRPPLFLAKCFFCSGLVKGQYPTSH